MKYTIEHRQINNPFKLILVSQFETSKKNSTLISE